MFKKNLELQIIWFLNTMNESMLFQDFQSTFREFFTGDIEIFCIDFYIIPINLAEYVIKCKYKNCISSMFSLIVFD